MRTPQPFSRLLTALTACGTTAVIAMAATGAGGLGAAEASLGKTVAAQVWLTTPDGSQRLSNAGTVTFGDEEPTAPTVVVDPTLTYQTMQGFGASITDSSAALLYSLSPEAREATMRSLFDPETGNGLSYLRQPIGGSDFVASAHYTYNDLPAGQTDFEQRRFSIAHDEAQILPLLRRAKAINPQLKVMASPWSPPAWMKTSGSLVGGQLIDQERIYRAYALYLVRFVQSYKANGVTVDALAVQNEPQNRKPSGYPGTDMPSWQQERVIEKLGPMLRKAGLRTKILAYDHNWSMHPDDIASTPPDQAEDVDRYVENVLSSSAARWVDGVAYHCYYGDPSAMSALHDRFPDQAIYFTECSGSQSSNPANTYSDTLKWHARNLIIGSTRNWAETVINWNLALDPAGGPHLGGCDTCTGVITIGSDGTVTRNAEYYTLGHVARFVQPGATRIASTSFGTTGWNGQIMDVAFRNPDGTTVLVAHNENDNPQSFAVRQGDQSFSYTLPGGALATFVWDGEPGGRPTLSQVDPAGWSATANPDGPVNDCCTGDVAANAVDGDASTRYSTGTGQAPGQHLTVDFGTTVPARRVVVDTGISTGDYPRGYSVETSRNGTTWTTVLPAADGAGQFTTVELDGTPVRYVRLTLTKAVDNWWSVADVRAYTDR
jgi:glucosylceramidase